MEKRVLFSQNEATNFFAGLEELTNYLFRKLKYYFGSPPWTQAHQAARRSLKVTIFLKIRFLLQ